MGFYVFWVVDKLMEMCGHGLGLPFLSQKSAESSGYCERSFCPFELLAGICEEFENVLAVDLLYCLLAWSYDSKMFWSWQVIGGPKYGSCIKNVSRSESDYQVGAAQWIQSRRVG